MSDQGILVSDLGQAIAWSTAALAAAADADWQLPAGTLTWSCWRTAEHVTDVLFSYAFQVAAGPGCEPLPFEELHADPTASPAGLIAGLRATGNLLSAVLTAMPAGQTVAWFGDELSAAGWAARAAQELLLHTHDILVGLGQMSEPPRALTDAVLAATRSDSDDAVVPDDPWAELVRASGRPFGADEVATWAAAAAERRRRRPPDGSEDGLVSDFADGEVGARFGRGWRALTDEVMGGASTAALAVVADGPPGVDHALVVSGELLAGSPWRWAGALFVATDDDQPANLSAHTEVTFWARGDGRPCAVWMVGPDGLGGRSSFRPKARWAPFTVGFGSLGTDGTDIRGLLFAAEGAVGPFELRLSDIRLT